MGKELVESVKIAPAQAATPPQCSRQHWADLLSNANPNANTNPRRALPFIAGTSQA